MDNEIKIIKDKILPKKVNKCNLSQSKINVKYQTNRQNDRVVTDIVSKIM
jgi:isocitrate dehydrogenase kinase/phosphatase